MKLIRPHPTYEVQDVPCYGTVRLTRGSDEALTLPDAFAFPRDDGGFLQSAAHAVIARVAFHNDNKATKQDFDGSDLYQKTSTFGIKYKRKAVWMAAFVDLPDEEASYELAERVYAENCAGRELIVGRTGSLVAMLLEQAQHEGRVCAVLRNTPRKLGTGGTPSAYGEDPYMVALFGRSDKAQLNAQYLHDEKQLEQGYVVDFTASDLDTIMKGREGQVLIHPVGLGGENCGVDVVYARNLNIHNKGRARGVIHAQQLRK